ncbi:MAG: McrC family protein [Clostridia bacterium]|nr:McrC family protein [Clostridia bacterium]
MAKSPYRITEYGSFVRGQHLDNYTYLPESVFDSLEQFVLENSEKGTDALDLMGISVRKNIGRVITAKNYVGVIALNDGNVIEILPKICGVEQEEAAKALLIKMLRTIPSAPFKQLQSTNVKTDNLPIFEIFIQMFSEEAFSVVKRGLKSGYETVDDTLAVCRGKIDFTRQIKYNHVHKERFCVQYDTFNQNRPENKLIKSTLKYLFKHSTSFKNKADLKLLLNAFENIEDSQDYTADLAKCTNDRQAKHYRTLLAWCRIFLQGKSFTSFSGSEIAYALLFPMETVFESYVAAQLKRQLDANKYTVSTQDTNKHLFDNPQKFSLRPDIVITEKSGAVFILDTKWKRLNDDPNNNYGIAQSDMYQMYAYQKKYAAKNVTLLYPLSDRSPQEKIQYTSLDGALIRVIFVDLQNVEKLSEDLNLSADS